MPLPYSCSVSLVNTYVAYQPNVTYRSPNFRPLLCMRRLSRGGHARAVRIACISLACRRMLSTPTYPTCPTGLVGYPSPLVYKQPYKTLVYKVPYKRLVWLFV